MIQTETMNLKRTIKFLIFGKHFIAKRLNNYNNNKSFSQ